MTIQNYLIIENNIVSNIVVWDGNTITWSPPIGSIVLVQETTPALIWETNSDKTNCVLVEALGVGDVGFTWDGSVLTTNQPQPAIPTV
jgi:hypothetical protein